MNQLVDNLLFSLFGVSATWILLLFIVMLQSKKSHSDLNACGRNLFFISIVYNFFYVCYLGITNV